MSDDDYESDDDDNDNGVWVYSDDAVSIEVLLFINDWY